MANPLNNLSVTLPFLVAISTLLLANASDPDILTDFLVPPSLDPDTITGQFFTFTGFRQLQKANLTGRTTALITKATKKEFPALDGQGVSTAVILYPPGCVIAPHIHPRSAELLLVVQGTLKVGFVDSKNRLFVQMVRPADLFVFPKGLVHFQVNVDSRFPAVAVGMFGSASAGRVELGEGMFGSGISEEILAKAFTTDEQTVATIVKGFE